MFIKGNFHNHDRVAWAGKYYISLYMCCMIITHHIIHTLPLTIRCEVPAGTREEARMQLIVSWIIDHPNAVSEEEVGVLVLEMCTLSACVNLHVCTCIYICIHAFLCC